MADILNPLFETVPRPTPQEPVQSTVAFDAGNVNQTVIDIQIAGQDVETGTKRLTLTRETGVFNEFSVSADFLETIKTTIAQSAGAAAITTTPVGAVVLDGADQTATLETIKTDVSQLIQSGEQLIPSTANLSTKTGGVYRNDIESVYDALGIKQDVLSPLTVFQSATVNVFGFAPGDVFNLGSTQDLIETQLVSEQQLTSNFEIATDSGGSGGSFDSFGGGG